MTIKFIHTEQKAFFVMFVVKKIKKIYQLKVHTRSHTVVIVSNSSDGLTISRNYDHPSYTCSVW